MIPRVKKKCKSKIYWQNELEWECCSAAFLYWWPGVSSEKRQIERHWRWVFCLLFFLKSVLTDCTAFLAFIRGLQQTVRLPEYSTQKYAVSKVLFCCKSNNKKGTWYVRLMWERIPLFVFFILFTYNSRMENPQSQCRISMSCNHQNKKK